MFSESIVGRLLSPAQNDCQINSSAEPLRGFTKTIDSVVKTDNNL